MLEGTADADDTRLLKVLDDPGEAVVLNIDNLLDPPQISSEPEHFMLQPS